jgi:uncharacterized membrane protein YphA (DoxX/SURF4 family)
MNVFLWVLQILLAAVFAMAGSTKLLQPYDKLRANPQMAWVGDFSPGTVKAIGSLELLAALGLILPAATGVAAWLTPTAGTGLAVLMTLAATHLRRHERQVLPVNAVLLVLAAVVAGGRTRPVEPLGPGHAARPAEASDQPAAIAHQLAVGQLVHLATNPSREMDM